MQDITATTASTVTANIYVGNLELLQQQLCRCSVH